MLSQLLIAWCLMAICVTVHAVGLTFAVRWMKRRRGPVEGRFWAATWMLICAAGWTLLMHLIQIAAWASFYSLKAIIPDFSSAFYFSEVTYTTTGYGDLVLPEEWHLFGGIEALTGILMCGLSAAFFFAIFTRIFGLGAGSRSSV